MTKLKRYQVFLADRAKQDLREIHDYILVNFYSQQAADGKTLSLYANRELSRILLYGEAYSVCCSYPKCKARLGQDFL